MATGAITDAIHKFDSGSKAKLRKRLIKKSTKESIPDFDDEAAAKDLVRDDFDDEGDELSASSRKPPPYQSSRRPSPPPPLLLTLFLLLLFQPSPLFPPRLSFCFRSWHPLCW
ncbi:hypothetical protein NE237_021873 [Protea cynaroides]|uniref:Uncharacterized protein n=1 Tax=Protea cynaroides TaxID=273540 RepID=A0A9Q0H9B9_9MAGN|nr:hypothetical protein NE237_021873 [Protea cynaroides]